MPPKGRPSSSHSSRPSRSSRPSSSHSSRSSRPSSSHSSRSSYSSRSSRPSSYRPSPPHRPSPPYRPSGYHSSGFGGPPPPPEYHGSPRYRRYTNGTSGFGCSRGPLGGCVAVIAVIVLVIFIALAVSRLKQENQSTQNTGISVGTESHQPIYVSALGRDVPWSAQYDSYYDAQTDCYFFLNADMDPPIWQYWFEGVSSQYGDFGWLEWDAKETRWYVQTGAQKWELLPEKYASDLWHFD